MTAMEASMNGDVLSFNSSSSSPSSYDVIEYREVWTSDVIQRVSTILVIMTLTLLGNSFIVYMLTCKLKRRHSRIDVFIVNLAIGDLTVCLVTMTTEILFVCFGEWLLGAVACKLMVYGQIITLASTTFLMTAMSYDRYQAICHPLRFYSRRRALWLVLSCWFAAFVFAAPQLFIFVQVKVGVRPDGKAIFECKSDGYTANWQRKVYFTWLTCYILVLPTILMTYFYANVVRTVWRHGRELDTPPPTIGGSGTASGSEAASCASTAVRRHIQFPKKSSLSHAKMKTIKMSMSIISIFILSWCPYFVVTLVEIYSNRSVPIPSHAYVIAETMTFFQSALNPFIYALFNFKTLRSCLAASLASSCAQPHRNSRPRLIVADTADSTNPAAHQQLKKKTVQETLTVADRRALIACDHASRGKSESSGDSAAHRASSGNDMALVETNSRDFKLRVVFRKKENAKLNDDPQSTPQGQILISD